MQQGDPGERSLAPIRDEWRQHQGVKRRPIGRGPSLQHKPVSAGQGVSERQIIVEIVKGARLPRHDRAAKDNREKNHSPEWIESSAELDQGKRARRLTGKV